MRASQQHRFVFTVAIVGVATAFTPRCQFGQRTLGRRAAAASFRMGFDLPIDVSAAQGLFHGALDSLNGQIGSLNGQLDSLAESVSGASNAVAATKDSTAASIASLKDQLGSAVDGSLAGLFRPFQDAAEAARAATASAKTGVVGEIAGVVGSAGEQAKGGLDALLFRFGTSTEAVIKEEEEAVRTLDAVVVALEGVLTPRTCFTAENVAVLPLWLAMVFAPGNEWTQRVMKGNGSVVLAALLYAWLAFEALKNPTALEGFSSGVADLGALTKGFSQEVSVATVWAHVIAQDLFVGRWVYLDGQRNKVWTSHSLALCFLFGPCGILAHLVTRGAVGIFRRDVQDVMSAGMTLPSAAVAAPSLPPAKPAAAAAKPTVATASASAVASTAAAEVRAAKARAQQVVSDAKSEAAAILKRAQVEAAQLVASARDQSASAASAASAVPSAEAAVAPAAAAEAVKESARAS